MSKTSTAMGEWTAEYIFIKENRTSPCENLAYLLNSSSQPCHCTLQFTNSVQITTTNLQITLSKVHWTKKLQEIKGRKGTIVIHASSQTTKYFFNKAGKIRMNTLVMISITKEKDNILRWGNKFSLSHFQATHIFLSLFHT